MARTPHATAWTPRFMTAFLSTAERRVRLQSLTRRWLQRLGVDDGQADGLEAGDGRVGGRGGAGDDGLAGERHEQTAHETRARHVAAVRGADDRPVGQAE